jgi:hypothetical protein
MLNSNIDAILAGPTGSYSYLTGVPTGADAFNICCSVIQLHVNFASDAVTHMRIKTRKLDFCRCARV